MSGEPLIAERATSEWQDLDARHYLHPFTDFKSLAAEGTRVITRAEGVYLYDTEGTKILDGMAGLWCVSLGYGRKELADAAYRQMQELPYYNSFFKSAHPPAIELARRLAELAPPQFNHVFFSGSGSEANDTIVRMARRYWDVRGEGDRKVIIARRNAYHGSTMAGASLGGMEAMHGQGGLPIPDIVHIEQPYWFENGIDVSPEEYGVRAARRLAEKIEEIGPQRVAAFIGEPIQGAGGVIIPPDSYWPEIQRICRHYGILLIADEVDLRLRTHRALVRLRALRLRTGLHDPRQGDHVRLPAAGRGHGGGPRRRSADRAGRRVPPRLHLFGAPGRLCRCAREPAHPARTRAWWTASARTSGPTCRSAGRNWATTRWWARPGASA